MSKYSKEQLMKYLNTALDVFEQKMSFYIRDNLIIEFFNGRNANKVYVEFCKNHFPDRYEEDHTLKDTGAEAFIQNGKYGLLIRESINMPPIDIQFMMFHEVAHLFCITHEYDGKSFYDEYCLEGCGEFAAGYAIWREAIADMIASQLYMNYGTCPISVRKDLIANYYFEINARNPDSKKLMSLIIGYVMLSREIHSAKNITEAKKVIESIGIRDHIFVSCLEDIFNHLLIQGEKYYKITPDFIYDLGLKYIDILSFKAFQLF